MQALGNLIEHDDEGADGFSIMVRMMCTHLYSHVFLARYLYLDLAGESLMGGRRKMFFSTLDDAMKDTEKVHIHVASRR